MGDLSAHFSLREFTTAKISRRRRREYEHLVDTLLEPTRSLWGACRVHSGVRSAMHNSSIGGAPLSMHVLRPRRRGVAADVSFARGTPTQWAATLDALGAPGLGLYATHVHVDTRRGRARW